MYGQLEEADTLIEDLCRDKVSSVFIATSHMTRYNSFLQDPLLRRSGMFTIAMAYCGSGDNNAIKRLLHVAVSSS